VDDAGGGLRGLRAVPTGEELTQALLRRYGIEVGRCRDLGGSSNLNLLVFDGAARYVVRVYRPYVTAGRLAAIHHVRRELDRVNTLGHQHLLPAAVVAYVSWCDATRRCQRMRQKDVRGPRKKGVGAVAVPAGAVQPLVI
jgi:hypothetical protein